jgi:FlaA1/EpsC-like NDP-sugar epimerase
MALIDAILVSLSLGGAVLLRFEGQISQIPQVYYSYYVFFTLLGVRLVTFKLCGLYRWSFAYASVHDFLAIARAMLYSSFVFFLFAQLTRLSFSWSIFLIESGLTFSLITAFRYSYRFVAHAQNVATPGPMRKVLIYGAGDLGEMVAREMMKNPEMGYLPVGFVEDNPAKHSIRVHSLEVLGPKKDIPRILVETQAEELIITVPTVAGKAVRDLIALCGDNHVRIKKISSFHEVLGDGFNLKQLKEVALEDLLGRPPVSIDLKEICSYLQSKVVIVTGGAGSIGAELCRQVLKYGVRKLILLDHNENKGHMLMLELRRQIKGDGNTEILFEIADVRDEPRIQKIFRDHRPDVVFHAAAHKHVPVMEQHPEEAVKNNVFGTHIVARAAHDFHAERFIMISTDKAVNPQSVMGITKRIAEYIVQDFARHSKTKFNSVRFGNVLGSDGSVIPIFKEQIARGGPVTVTHPEATRYFMTIPEAVQLLIQAAALGTGREIFILDMGEPVRVLDLARNLITLSGLVPNRDIEITFIGLRPGEKLYEELLTAEEGISTTRHQKVFRVRANGDLPEGFQKRLAMLKVTSESNDRPQVRALLREFGWQISEFATTHTNGDDANGHDAGAPISQGNGISVTSPAQSAPTT